MSNSTSVNSTVAAAILAFDGPGSNYATTVTNVLYLFILIPLMFKGRHRFFPEMLSIMAAMYFSTVYHACRDIGPGACPHDSSLEDTLRRDMMAAYLAVSAGTSPFVYCYSSLYKIKGVPFLRAHPVYRAFWFTFMSLLTFTLLTWTSPNEEALSFSLIGTFNLVMLFWCASVRFRYLVEVGKADGSGSWTRALVFAFAFTVAQLLLLVGGLLHILVWSNAVDSYSTYHSIWHACTAIAGFINSWLLPGHDEIKRMEARTGQPGDDGYVNLQQTKSLSPSSSAGTAGKMKGLV